MRNKKHLHLGFTLVELVLYIGLLSIFISGAVLFAWDLIFAHTRSQVQWEINQNLRLASKRILYEIRNASDINTVAASCISLANTDPARDPTIIDLSGGRVRIVFGENEICPPTSSYVLTSNKATVSNLVFENLSTGSSKNIGFTITIETTGAKKEWQLSQTYQSTAELRSF